MNIKDIGGSTLLVVTPQDLREFAEHLMMEASAKLTKTEEPTYTPKEFAARHHCDVSTLWRWVQNGLLTKTLVGGKVFYRDSDLKIRKG